MSPHRTYQEFNDDNSGFFGEILCFSNFPIHSLKLSQTNNPGTSEQAFRTQSFQNDIVCRFTILWRHKFVGAKLRKKVPLETGTAHMGNGHLNCPRVVLYRCQNRTFSIRTRSPVQSLNFSAANRFGTQKVLKSAIVCRFTITKT